MPGNQTTDAGHLNPATSERSQIARRSLQETSHPPGHHNMPSSLHSPFQELDTNLPRDLLALLSEGNLEESTGEAYDYSSCPVSINEERKSWDHLSDLGRWPLQTPWRRDSSLPAPNELRHIPFQADRSVSMIEESKKVSANSKLSSSRYKTELCRTFEENGSCKYGVKCQFAHGSVELRGLNRHPKYKTELCRSYHTVGFCTYGSRCHFIHEVEEQRFNSCSKSKPPHCLKHSMSCPGVSTSSSTSSSLSIFSSSSSDSPFTPSTPTFSASEPLSSSDTACPLKLRFSPSLVEPVSSLDCPPQQAQWIDPLPGALFHLPAYHADNCQLKDIPGCESNGAITDRDCASPPVESLLVHRLPIFDNLLDE